MGKFAFAKPKTFLYIEFTVQPGEAMTVKVIKSGNRLFGLRRHKCLNLPICVLRRCRFGIEKAGLW